VKPAVAVLAQAARAVAAVVDEGRSADDALAVAEAAAQRAAIRAVTLGTLRWYLRLRPALEALLTQPQTPPTLHALLVVGLHQLQYSRNRPEITVSAAVDAARVLKHARAAGLVNAALRRFLREREALLARIDRELAPRSAHPLWLVQALQNAWPADYEPLLNANNAHPPMTLRVDTSRVSIEEYLSQLRACGLEAHSVSWLHTAVTLSEAVAVADLPGFDAGLVSVQDAGAQYAALLLQVRAGERVLDACAAPGGKTGALLEAAGGELQLLAVDADAVRLQRVAGNLRRLQRSAQLRVADLRQGLPGEAPFERILVDAPCSSVGVIRRHPDIKLLRRSSDIAALVDTQAQILRGCYALLKRGGCLLYCTCSVLPDENERVIAEFLAQEDTAREIDLPPALALPPDLRRCQNGWQLLPGAQAGADGFYYACLTRG